MSLYYVLLRVWLHFGHSEFFIRSLSALIAAATIPVIYCLGRVLYDRRVALIASALFAFNAYSVRYAQEARSYALFLLLATLSSVFLVSQIREPSRRNWLGYVLTSILAVYAHFYALLLLIVHWLAVRRPGGHIPITGQADTRIVAGLRRAWITIGIAVLPLLAFVAKTGAGPIRWIPRPGFRDVLAFYQQLAGGSNWILPAAYALSCIAAVMPYRVKLSVPARNWELWRTQFLLIWLFVPVALTALLSFARPVFLGRYMIFCLPALLMLVAEGLARLRKPWLLGVALAAILLLNLQGVFFVYGHDFDNERDASGAATNFILDHSEPGDAILFHIAGTRIPYEFFRSVRAGENTAGPTFTRAFGPEIIFPYHGAGLDYRDFTGKPTTDFLRGVGDSHPRVWVMLMNNGSAGNPDPTTVMVKQILAGSFPKVLCWQFPKAEVRLYSKR
jgi:mannosyltransferase